MYADKTLACVECGAPFTFSAEDQEFHTQKGFTNEPKRCPRCRANRRAARSEGSPYYAGAREMFTATCAQCGKEARVPFQPRGDKPVYCSDCYQSRSAGPTYAGGRSGRGSSRNGNRW